MSLLGAALVLLAVLVWPARPSRRAATALVRRVGQERPRPVPGPDHMVVRRFVDSVRRRSRRGGPQWGTRRWGRRHTGVAPRVDDLFPLLDGLAGALRAGLPAAEALDLVGADLPDRVHQLVRPVRAAAAAGYPCAAAWERAARESTSPDLALLARSWAVSERLGAPLADAVDSTARGLRSRRALAARLATATAGARATVTVLTLLPAAGVGLAALMGIGPAELYGSPVAVASLVLGCVLLAVGRVVVHRMINRVRELA